MPESVTEIDHIFVIVSSPKEGEDPVEAGMLKEAGLVESYRRNHPGQGTTNICYCFDNAYLELLWVNDRDDVQSERIKETRLFERSQWTEINHYSPFGIALRQHFPFEAWDYCPPYLPKGMSIPVSKNSRIAENPFIFKSPGGKRPDSWDGGQKRQSQAPIKSHDIASITLEIPSSKIVNDELKTLNDFGFLSLKHSSLEHKMTLSLSDKTGKTTKYLSLPNCQVTEAR